MGVSTLPTRVRADTKMYTKVCVTMNFACKSFAALVAVRILLDCFEAAVAPALILVTSMWCKKSEQPMRIGFWYLGVGCGTIVCALSSY
jgi:MFS family permease